MGDDSVAAMDLADAQQTKDVVVHPIVLLSVVDHFSRMSKGTNKRVVGTLLGEISGGQYHVTNSFAVPFEEDARDPNVWFLDHNYHEKMYIMFKKINTKQRVIGWYSTGPKLKASDLAIHELYRPYCGGQDPILVLLDVQPRAVSLELPMVAYRSMQEATSNKMFKRAFYHVPSLVGASEPEEVGVEHLLRDIRNASASTLATKVADKLTSLRTLVSKLKEIADYLSQVAMGKLPENTQIIYNLQNIFNLLPEDITEDLAAAFAAETNDMMLGIYLASMLRSVVALHNLIDNKLENKKAEETAEKEAKDKEKKAKEEAEEKKKKEEEEKKKKEGKDGEKKDDEKKK